MLSVLSRTKGDQKTIFLFSSPIPMSASSIGFVAGEFHEQVKTHENQIIAAITRVHHYMINYGSYEWFAPWIAAATVDKAVSFLDSIIMNDSIRRHKLIPSTVVAFVTDSPEPYSVSYGLVLINRNQLIGEKVFNDSQR